MSETIVVNSLAIVLIVVCVCLSKAAIRITYLELKQRKTNLLKKTFLLFVNIA